MRIGSDRVRVMGLRHTRRSFGLAVPSLCLLLLAVWIVGCGSSDPPPSNAAATTKERQSGPTQAILHPLAASGVSGRVVYVNRSPAVPLMKVHLRGVERATGETQYFIWQFESRHNMVALGDYHVSRGDKLDVTFEPYPEGLPWLEEGSTTEMLITLVHSDDRFYAAQEHARSYSDPSMIGTPVARGPFTGPLVGSPKG